MDLPELIILDVGHGSCALLRETNSTIVIDCGPNATLIDVLDHLNIRDISTILISHADQDHIGGVIDILSRRSYQEILMK